MKPRTIYRPFFGSPVPKRRKNVRSIKEEIEDVELRIIESPPESKGNFKALDIEGLTLSYDADEISILHTPDGHLYIRTYGKLIVLYSDHKNLEGNSFVAESIQKIKINDSQKTA